MSQAQKCKELSRKGLSIQQICKELGLARNTVRSYLRGNRIPGEYVMKSAREQPSQEKIREEVRALLVAERDGSTPRKQRLTAARIHRILVERNHTISERTVNTVVRAVKIELRDALKHAYLPLEYRPGEDAQVDFFEGEVDDRTLGRIKVFILLVRACYSGKCYAYAAPNQTREALLEGMMQAFEFFGGVFVNLWFDNLTPAVKRVLKGRTRVMQTKFAAFEAHYGFQAQFCGPAKGNEKGGVEGEVKYSRHEILTPVPEIEGRPALQQLCWVWIERDGTRTIRGRERSINEMWQDEVSELIELPALRFEVADMKLAKVSGRSWIQTGTNFYSTPVHWVGQFVSLKVEAERVVIIGPAGEAVEHARKYGSRQMSLELDHYLPLLERKHRGLDRAIPVRRFLEQQDPAWRVLLAGLRKRYGEVQGSKDFVAVLQMCKPHGTAEVTAAVREAVGNVEISLALVRYYLWHESEESDPSPERIEYSGPTATSGSAADYDDLLESKEVRCG